MRLSLTMGLSDSFGRSQTPELRDLGSPLPPPSPREIKGDVTPKLRSSKLKDTVLSSPVVPEHEVCGKEL